ncbi:hypothetical protein BDV98DRAFT_593996 [Pterulicium gracile]|uniref:Uncharacterized protein n=1 Tax=Pterulicium gracile TaxID=1884261 RepID=A0A5C3QGQ8_9AGAR|nr:hypothetical protein BDV98DRAFT_593996 [Pterula gracilis]
MNVKVYETIMTLLALVTFGGIGWLIILILRKEERREQEQRLAERRALKVAAPIVVPQKVKYVSHIEVASFSSDSETVIESDSTDEVTIVKARRGSFFEAVKGVKTVCRKIRPAKESKSSITAADLSTFRFPGKSSTTAQESVPKRSSFKSSLTNKARSLRRWSV